MWLFPFQIKRETNLQVAMFRLECKDPCEGCGCFVFFLRGHSLGTCALRLPVIFGPSRWVVFKLPLRGPGSSQGPGACIGGVMSLWVVASLTRSSGDVRIRQPTFVGSVYFSKGSLPQKRGEKGTTGGSSSGLLGLVGDVGAKDSALRGRGGGQST